MQKSLIRRILMAVGATMLLIGLMTPAALAATKPTPPPTNTASVAVAPKAPAVAAPDCPSGYLCFWRDINYSGGRGKLAGTNSSWFAFSHSTCSNGTWADCASSIWNNGPCTARVYYLTGFGAPYLDIPRGTGYPNLTQVSTGLGNSWNDNIESNRWLC